MLVDPADGRCRECGGPLTIEGCDDATMTVGCVDCGDSYAVEPDAFGDGGLHYWPAAQAEQRHQG